MAAISVAVRRLAVVVSGVSLLSLLLVTPAFADSPLVDGETAPASPVPALVAPSSAPDGGPSTLAEAQAHARSRPVVRQGVDVSIWQGYIDWQRVARTSVDFVVAKATEGTGYVDPWYALNAVRARKAGIYFTAYHFARPQGGGRDARAAADFFLKHARLRPGDLVPALDLERSGTLSDAQLVHWTLIWLQHVHHKLGVMPMVYSNPGFWMSHMANSTAIAKAGFEILWIGHWGTRRPLVPARKWAGKGWTFWQYTDCGHVAGINGCVDRDTFHGPKLHYLTIGQQRQQLRSAT